MIEAWTTGRGRRCSRLRVGDHELPTQNTILNGSVEASSKRAQMILMAPTYALHVRNDRDHGMNSLATSPSQGIYYWVHSWGANEIYIKQNNQ